MAELVDVLCTFALVVELVYTPPFAAVAELADAYGLGPYEATREGSNPSRGR